MQRTEKVAEIKVGVGAVYMSEAARDTALLVAQHSRTYWPLAHARTELLNFEGVHACICIHLSDNISVVVLVTDQYDNVSGPQLVAQMNIYGGRLKSALL
jgi:hypothetical protein